MTRNKEIKNYTFLKIIRTKGKPYFQNNLDDDVHCLDTNSIANILKCSNRTVVLRMKKMEKMGLVIGKKKGRMWLWLLTHGAYMAIGMYDFSEYMFSEKSIEAKIFMDEWVINDRKRIKEKYERLISDHTSEIKGIHFYSKIIDDKISKANSVEDAAVRKKLLDDLFKEKGEVKEREDKLEELIEKYHGYLDQRRIKELERQSNVPEKQKSKFSHISETISF